LKDEQDGPTVLGIEHVLQLGERLNSQHQYLLGARFVLRGQIKCIAGIDVPEAEALAFRNTEWFAELS